MASKSSQNDHTKMFGKLELIFLTATMHTRACEFDSLPVLSRLAEDVRRRGDFCSCVALSNIVPGVFTPVLAKYMKQPSLIDVLLIRIDRIQRDSREETGRSLF